MKTIKIPMNATRAVRLSKVLKTKDKRIAFLLEEGLKNLANDKDSFPRKV